MKGAGALENWGNSVRGRKPKPAELERAQGYPRRRKTKTDAIIAATESAPETAPLSTAPPPPDDLDEVGRAKWVEMASHLVRHMILKSSDYDTLHVYCQCWQDYCWLRKKVGRKYTVKTKSAHVTMHRRNPLAAELEKKRREVTELARELGLTPASRLSMQTRLQTVNDPKRSRHAPVAGADPATGKADGTRRPPASPIGALKAGARPN